jgi:hypothetical protein
MESDSMNAFYAISTVPAELLVKVYKYKVGANGQKVLLNERTDELPLPLQGLWAGDR